MSTIAGVRIQPGFFKQKPRAHEARAGVSPSFKTKGTVARRPSNPKAKYAMPVLAIVGAYTAVTAAATAVTAVGAFATFAAGAATVFSVITAVGAVAYAVGSVTGNQELMKIGGIIGIAGLVGGFATGQGFFGGAEGAAGVDAGAGVGAGAESAGGAGISGADVIAADNPVGMISSSAPPIAETVTAGMSTPGIDVAAQQVAQAPITGAPQVQVATPPMTEASRIADSAAGITTQTPPMSDMAGATGTPNPQTAGLAPPDAFDNLAGMFKGLGKFVNDNKGLSEIMLKGLQAATGNDARDEYYSAAAAKSRQDATNAGTMGRIDMSGLVAGVKRPTVASGMISAASRGA